LDDPPRVAVDGYLQRCLPEKDTAALSKIRQLRAVDASSAAKKSQFVLAVRKQPGEWGHYQKLGAKRGDGALAVFNAGGAAA
jgi:hypothetical protein